MADNIAALTRNENPAAVYPMVLFCMDAEIRVPDLFEFPSQK